MRLRCSTRAALVELLIIPFTFLKQKYHKSCCFFKFLFFLLFPYSVVWGCVKLHVCSIDDSSYIKAQNLSAGQMATAKVTVFFILSVGLVSACFGPVEVGKPCENNGNGTERGIHYFFDDLRNRIYPFFYEGCGGESHNRFKTEQKARMCLASFAPSTGSCSNHPRPPAGITPFPALREEKCPEGSECKLLWNGGGGFCCDKAIAGWLSSSYFLNGDLNYYVYTIIFLLVDCTMTPTDII
uniref:BPTI/Kunitz inhibitor domain-containing protein n=1 Tax=Heterorhabditis bacteriophora TaxID=37862 RepID=A0A1I7WEJ9_HETBA